MLGSVQLFAGLVAALGAAVYVAGGIVFALRLAFAELPAVGVIGQLPREFLLSVGAIQVVGPAVVLGTALGVLEFLQGDPREKIEHGFKPWWEAKGDPRLRRTYVRFYAGAPIVLVAPGLCVAIAQDEDIKHTAVEVVSVAVVVAAAVAAVTLWSTSARASRVSVRRTPGVESDGGANDRLRPREWALEVSGGVLALVVAFVLLVETKSGRYLWIVPAWGLSFLLALLLVWLRRAVRDGFLRAEAGNQSGAPWIVLAWASTALFLVPAFLVLAAASPLQQATLCTHPTDETAYNSAGRFIGETKERAYVSDATGRIISVPTDKVSRLIIGGDADTRLC